MKHDKKLMQLSKDLEHYITDRWAAEAILHHVDTKDYIVDPCCGSGVLSDVIKETTSISFLDSYDVYDWGYPGTERLDFLKELIDPPIIDFTVFMNPPFSKACEFVQRSFDVGASQVICFQRFAWWESRKRKEFWEKYKPSDVYICGDRATCWRHDLPQDDQGNRYHPETGNKMASSSTAHAWFVWNKPCSAETKLHHIYKIHD